jgi:hypothetical protein
MNAFDKFCAIFSFLLGLVLLVLGVIGLFTGCKANFSLPPVLGVLPALVGWGIVRSVYFAWSAQRPPWSPPPFEPPEVEPHA